MMVICRLLDYQDYVVIFSAYHLIASITKLKVRCRGRQLVDQLIHHTAQASMLVSL